MFKKYIALEHKDYFHPYNENDKPSWQTHHLFHIPKTEFAEFNKVEPNTKLNIMDIGQERFQQLLEEFSKLDFTPDLIFSNSGDLQGWKNFHIHAIKGERINPDFWSIFDTFKELNFSKSFKISAHTFHYAVTRGTRSFQDKRKDSVYVVDISPEVIKNNTIHYNSLKETIMSLVNSFQHEPLEMGTIVFVPEGNLYKVYYILKTDVFTKL